MSDPKTQPTVFTAEENAALSTFSAEYSAGLNGSGNDLDEGLILRHRALAVFPRQTGTGSQLNDAWVLTRLLQWSLMMSARGHF